MKSLFHLAFPVHDLKAARTFYVEGLGCRPGRESPYSLILNLGGNQIVAQVARGRPPRQKGIYPRHFGLVFASLQEWKKLVERARKKRLRFYQRPRVRYGGTPLEHRTVFLQDPSNNLLEFKYYSRPSAIFGGKKFRKVGDQGSMSLKA